MYGILHELFFVHLTSPSKTFHNPPDYLFTGTAPADEIISPASDEVI